MHRIVVEDARQPETSAILCESKHTAWALVSPDDQWIAVDERNGADGSATRLYHRAAGASFQYSLAQDTGAEGSTLQDAVWKAYLSATNAEPDTSRKGVTIDAAAWENDSRKLDVSVAYLPGPNDPDVPAPWSCTYDVTSKQVQPTSSPEADRKEDESAVAEEPAPRNEGESADAIAEKAGAENDESQETEMGEQDEYPGEKFPATRLDELTVEDVNESSLSEIDYAINEMFARHGAEFKDKKVAKQFSEFSWYTPRPELSLDDIENEFSDLEKQNLAVLKRCRDSKLAAARHKAPREREESTREKVLRGIRAWQDMGGPMPPHP